MMEESVGRDKSLKRVKIFTIHGTFDNEADWDNWADQNAPQTDNTEKTSKANDTAENLPFVNRLSHYLNEQGVAFDKTDHSEYNWSGGNSHDERRIAALGLKKRIEMDLRASEQEHGIDYKDYYNGGVYLIGHSHGGTISRLAMNLWDKADNYYDAKAESSDQLKHNDKCGICLQRRNGEVVPNSIDRPDGVITFGSPFVRFKPRKMGLLAVRILTWTLMLLGLVTILAYYSLLLLAPDLLKIDNLPFLSQQWVQTVAQIVWPLLVYWLFALYIPSRIIAWVSRQFGNKGGKLFLATSVASLVKISGFLALVAFYYIAYLNKDWATAQSWFATLPSFGMTASFWAWFPLVVYWLLAISLPGRLLAWLRNEVEALRIGLAEKYDPSEDAALETRYLSYYTPGDEAGIGLRFFGVLTWIVQTFWLAAGMTVFVATLAVLASFPAFFTTYDPQLMIKAVDTLIWLPVELYNFFLAGLIGEQMHYLRDMDNARQLAEKYPYALFILATTLVILMMPVALVIILIVYAVAVWLRGSGLVYGSERFTWTLANNIGATTRPSDYAKMRRMFIWPEARWNSEMAHCYFYKCDRVIRDVADHITDWKAMTVPVRSWPIASILSQILRWVMVLFFALSLFMVAVWFTATYSETPSAAVNTGLEQIHFS